MMEYLFNEQINKTSPDEKRQVIEYIKEHENALMREFQTVQQQIIQIDIATGNEEAGKIIPMNFVEYSLTRIDNNHILIERVGTV